MSPYKRLNEEASEEHPDDRANRHLMEQLQKKSDIQFKWMLVLSVVGGFVFTGVGSALNVPNMNEAFKMLTSAVAGYGAAVLVRQDKK